MSDYQDFVKTITPFGDTTMTFKTEIIKGAPLLDTVVKICDEQICYISYPDKDAFLQELQAVINKYRI